MNKLILSILILFSTFTLKAQQEPVLGTEVVGGDTFVVYQFKDVVIREKRDEAARQRYLKLIRDVKITLPYAKMAAFRLQMMEQNLNLLKSEKAKKAYIKETEKAIKEEFMNDLKNLTVTQGKLLIKLIHRETGNTTYGLLENFKGDAAVFFWSSLASMFGSNLKTEYDPIEDYQIENIIKSFGLE